MLITELWGLIDRNPSLMTMWRTAKQIQRQVAMAEVIKYMPELIEITFEKVSIKEIEETMDVIDSMYR